MPQANPRLLVVTWREPSGRKASWHRLAQSSGDVLLWLLLQRPYLAAPELYRQIEVKPYSRPVR